MRLVDENDLLVLHRWMNSETALGAFDEAHFPSLDDIQKKYRSGGYKTTWIIEVSDSKIGYANFAVHPWDDWIACIGIFIAEPSYRKRGFGTAAHKLLIQEIFEKFPNISKLEAFTDVENVSEMRALQKSGFFQEGTQKRKNKLRGQYRDMHVFGFLRPEENFIKQ